MGNIINIDDHNQDIFSQKFIKGIQALVML